MVKKSFIAIAAICAIFAFAMPTQAQLGKGLGKSLGKAAKSAGKAVGEAASGMATDMAANQVSAKMATFMDNNNNLAPADNEYYKRLEALVAAKYTTVNDLSLTYNVYLNDEANILALADGNIRVYSGMMDLLSDDELLAVIAVQIGHIANKDVRDNLMKVASEDNAGKAAGNQIEKMLAFSGDKLGSVINELIQVPYTEEQNYAADAFAKELLTKNGSNTEALISALNKFAELEATDAAAAESEEGEISSANKFIGVNSGNSLRANRL